MTNLRDLGYLKSGSMFGHFNNGVLGYVSPYFAPLKPYLRSFWYTLHPIQAFDDVNPVNCLAHSKATPMDIINIFKTALMDEDLITQLKSTQSILGKCSAPGDLIPAHNGWDVVAVSDAADPHLGEVRKKRKMKCMTRRHRSGKI